MAVGQRALGCREQCPNLGLQRVLLVKHVAPVAVLLGWAVSLSLLFILVLRTVTRLSVLWCAFCLFLVILAFSSFFVFFLALRVRHYRSFGRSGVVETLIKDLEQLGFRGLDRRGEEIVWQAGKRRALAVKAHLEAMVAGGCSGGGLQERGGEDVEDAGCGEGVVVLMLVVVRMVVVVVVLVMWIGGQVLLRDRFHGRVKRK